MPPKKSMPAKRKPAAQKPKPAPRSKPVSKPVPVPEPEVEIDLDPETEFEEEVTPVEEVKPKRTVTRKTTVTTKPTETLTGDKPKRTVARKPATKKEPVPEQEKESEESSGKRTFKLLVNSVKPSVDDGQLNGNGGRYVGKTPMQAAKKCFTQLCRKVALGKACEFAFTIQESTQGSEKKQRSYKGVRSELDEPQEIVRANTSYIIRFKNDVKSLSKTSEEE